MSLLECIKKAYVTLIENIDSSLDINESQYPVVNGTINGLDIRDEVPNTSSISASLGDDYTVLNGIREVRYSDGWQGSPYKTYYSASDIDRCKDLAERIKESGEINPLIVVIAKKGEPYILEGLHRFCALWLLELPSFPALIVVENV